MKTYKVAERKPTKTLRKFLKYYETLVFHQVKRDPTWTITVNRRFSILYIISRLVAAINIITLLRLLFLFILEGRENESSVAFKVSGLILYMLAYSMIPYYDINVFRSEILPNVEKSVTTCEEICTKISFRNEHARKLQKEMSTKMWRIFLHNCAIDYLTLLDIAMNTFGNLANLDPIMLYSEISWKNPVFDLIYWIAGMLLIFVMEMTWSWLITLPGCLAYQYECLLKGLTAHLKSTGNWGIGRTGVLEYYSSLECSTRLLFEKGFSKALLSLYGLAALQQTVTSFFIFNVIRNGGGWKEIEVFVLDLIFSTSRIFHGYYALSRVSNANKDLLDMIEIHLTKREAINWRSKIIRRKAKILRKLKITVGPYRCDSNFPLAGGGVYLDNIVTAALWQ